VRTNNLCQPSPTPGPDPESASDAQLAAILETAVEGIIVISRDGIIESYNRAAETMFGYSAGEVIGRNVSMLMAAPHHAQHDQPLSWRNGFADDATPRQANRRDTERRIPPERRYPGHV